LSDVKRSGEGEKESQKEGLSVSFDGSLAGEPFKEDEMEDHQQAAVLVTSGQDLRDSGLGGHAANMFDLKWRWWKRK
jgi:hypothetical protein